ncbi:DUF885 family protein [Pseudonocardia sp. H11422]|uniref:DUF885 family protein n=1 Tax=Pseudonocardia sp. H11422 TaxID=2835866 RepID=UPI001BDDAD0D|nr:DUF885 family protein [Pseudonocardia sp. H11422]
MARDLLVRDYLLLGLRLDRLAPGLVDTYTGDPALRRHVAAEVAPDPVRLLQSARRLGRELPGTRLSPRRERFLAGQLTALECVARRLTGEQVGFVAELEACYGVRVAPGDEDEYRHAHDELDELLPGSGTLADRLAAWRRRDEMPRERLAVAVHAVSEALRERVREQFPLPPAETVSYEVVSDRPWSGLHRYLGAYRSHVAVNADARLRMAQLPHLVAHESYPGHHTEHCRKEAGLVARARQDEQTIFLANTPQCLMAEGMADLGLQVAVGPGWGPWAEEVLAEVGLRTDGVTAERVDRAMLGLLRVRQDAALLLHDRHASADDALAHLRRWLLIDEPRARQMLRFLAHPLWRAYTTTYVEGAALLRSWLGCPGPGASVQRYRRLLDEPLVPAAVRTEPVVAAGSCVDPNEGLTAEPDGWRPDVSVTVGHNDGRYLIIDER